MKFYLYKTTVYDEYENENTVEFGVVCANTYIGAMEVLDKAFADKSIVSVDWLEVVKDAFGCTPMDMLSAQSVKKINGRLKELED